jgi:hypothetical protein
LKSVTKNRSNPMKSMSRILYTEKKLTNKKKMSIKENETISYRPNHVDRRRRNCGTAQVAPERGPLSAGSPRIVLPYLHVIILNKVRS